jgi:hypothetical protein
MADAMRGVHFTLTDSQKQRLSGAQQQLAHLAGSVYTAALVNVGDTIPVDYDSGFLRSIHINFLSSGAFFCISSAELAH